MKKRNTHRVGAWIAASVGHLTGVVVVGMTLMVLLMPPAFAVQVTRVTLADAELLRMSTPMALTHIALAACIWALTWLTFTYVRERRREMTLQGRRAVRLARGSIIVETLVVFPVWVLLTFGMAQMVINNIAGALANVAAYEAGRAAWLWKPEVGVRAGVTNAKALDRARTAAAMVMVPVAAGDFFGSGSMDGDAAKMREALLLTHVPFVGGSLPSGSADAVSLLSLIDPVGTRNNQNVPRALDVSPFIIRTVKKFTHAYNATTVAFDATGGRTGVRLTYKHYIAMPMMGPLFSSGNFTTVGMRPGYYAQFTRTYGFRTQINTPNASLPSTGFLSSPPSGGDPGGAISDAVGF